MAERRPWRRLVESYTVVRHFRIAAMWVWMGEGCWAGDVGVALVGAIMCPGKSIQPRSRYVMDHQGSTAKQLHPRRPVASSRRASTFIALARSTTQQPASPTSPPLPAPSRPTTPSASTYFLSSPSTARQPPSHFSPPCRREYSRVDAQAAPGSHSSSSCC